MKKILILCLGNDILCDDAIGAVVAKRLEADKDVMSLAEVIFAPLAGLNLIEFINDCNNVLIIDSIITKNKEPGNIHFFPAGYLTPSNNLVNSHQISLPTALKFGKQLGYKLTENIDIIAVEVNDITTISETMTIEVSEAVNKVIDFTKEWLNKTIINSSANNRVLAPEDLK